MSYVKPYVFPQAGTFQGRTVVTKITPDDPFTVQEGAYSIQQNLWGADHFYQNSLLQNATVGLIWHLEAFRRKADGSFPSVGQFFVSTDPAGVVPSSNPFGTPIPGDIDLRLGGYEAALYTLDTGTTIAMRLEIFPPVGGRHYDSGWELVGGTDATYWYDPLLAVNPFVGGIGYGAKATFSGSFLVEVNAGVPLSVGGTYWKDGEPFTDPFPALPDVGTAEKSNLTWPVVDRGSNTDGVIKTLGPLTVNDHTYVIYIPENGTLNWSVAGLTDDEGGLVQFGAIAHGVDPAPADAGFMVLDEKTADEFGGAVGSYQLEKGVNVYDGNSFDVYAYDAAKASKEGYSQPVVVNITDAIQLRGSPA